MYVPPPDSPYTTRAHAPLSCIYGPLEYHLDMSLPDTFEGRALLDEVYWARCQLRDGVAESELSAWMHAVSTHRDHDRTLSGAKRAPRERA